MELSVVDLNRLLDADLAEAKGSPVQFPCRWTPGPWLTVANGADHTCLDARAVEVECSRCEEAMFDLFGKSSGRPTLESVSFDAAVYTPREASGAMRAWTTPEG